MPYKNTKQTPEGAAAGAANLAKWLGDHPERGNLKHGAYSVQVWQRYSDLRTSEGKQLATTLKGLTEDVGHDLSTGRCLLLDRIREKLIVLMQIGKYADHQAALINQGGELIPVLGRNYTAYSEGLRKDLESFYSFGSKKKPVDLNQYLAGAYGKGAK